ncbi:MAG: helix-turn-helix domain-containing protein [Opitutaceae bacterium]|jgi:transcriptional regulator with XRE-family HTH domain|nr:helix-turn-helix domain-containing protein [Opitutaceae bacterium]
MEEEGKPELLALGEAIRRGRKLLKVSQEDFAELCDLHRTYIGQIERGEKNISFINILRVSKTLNRTPSQLFAEAGL